MTVEPCTNVVFIDRFVPDIQSFMLAAHRRFTLVGVGDICLAGACPRIGSLKVNGEWSEDVKRTWKNTRGDAPVQASKGRFLLEGACKQSGPWRLWNFTIKEIAPAVNQTVSREAQVEVGDTTSDVE